ncbi:glycosyltransferase family 4 protein [Wenyingzhuangia sp. IMCC45574]
MQSLLVIGYVWPEPSATAAGSRMLQLIHQFKELEYAVTFACPAVKPATAFNLQTIGVKEELIALNSVSFDDFIKEMNPTVVMFDRFLMEEQFGWRVTENAPNALRLLDSEDLHFLRKAREKAVKKGERLPENMLLTDEAKREIASMYRCDATLTISEFEMEYLQKTYQIPSDLLWYVPFLIEVKQESKPDFTDREDFIFIGNFIHPPNWDAVLQLKTEIWPLLRKKLPNARLHVYGGYPSEKVYQLHNKQQGFLVHGRANDVAEVMQKVKVCLAPLRFGAGLKGKLIDAMQNNTPFVTSSVGAEGMFGVIDFSASIADLTEEFVEKSVAIYTDSALWNAHAVKGKEVLSSRFSKELFQEKFNQKLSFLLQNIKSHRDCNFIGAMLQHHSLKSAKYLSKWIEEKNKH